MYKEINFNAINEWFYIDEASPSGLRWKRDCPMKIRNNKNFRERGDVAGSFNGKYWRVTMDRKTYVTSRIVYCLVHKSIPGYLKIDHIDGNTSNNAHHNLRLVDVKVNGRNRKLNINNQTGIPQIARVIVPTTNGKTNEYFRVCVITDDGTISKGFNIGKLGEDTALRLAIEYRVSLFNILLGNNYSERHLYGK